MRAEEKKKKKECARRDHLGRFAAEQSRVEQSIGKERKRAIAAYVGGGWQRAPYANENFPFQLVCMRDGPECMCARCAASHEDQVGGVGKKGETRCFWPRARIFLLPAAMSIN